MEEYKKDFDGWNIMKKKLNGRNQELSFYEKEIWWCSMGVNVGSEEDGKGDRFLRPVYILKKISSKTFIGIPLTSILKEDYAHMSFYFDYCLSTAIISQIKVFDKKRLIEFIGTTSDYLHRKMKKTTVAFILS